MTTVFVSVEGAGPFLRRHRKLALQVGAGGGVGQWLQVGWGGGAGGCLLQALSCG